MQIYLYQNGEQVGPYTEDQIASMVLSGQIARDDIAWREGLSEWQPIQSIISLPALVPPAPQFNLQPELQRTSHRRASAAHLRVQSRTEPLAIFSLVLGIISICSLVLGIISVISFASVTGIAAAICGHIGRSKIKKKSALTGAGMALAGLITGYTGIFVQIGAGIAIPNIASPVRQAEEACALRNAQNLASIASAASAAGYTNTWTTKMEAITELRSGITVNLAGTKFEFKSYDLTSDQMAAASRHLQLVGHKLEYVP